MHAEQLDRLSVGPQTVSREAMPDETEWVKEWRSDMNFEREEETACELRPEIFSRTGVWVFTTGRTNRNGRATTADPQTGRKKDRTQKEIEEKRGTDPDPLDPANINQRLASSWTQTLSSTQQTAPRRSVCSPGSHTLENQKKNMLPKSLLLDINCQCQILNTRKCTNNLNIRFIAFALNFISQIY